MNAHRARASADDARILFACPFCGEAECLSVSGCIPRPLIVGDDTLKERDGSELTEEVDGVVCWVCEAIAPLDVWNHQRPERELAILRAFDRRWAGVAA
jgi:hypothetical protein